MCYLEKRKKALAMLPKIKKDYKENFEKVMEAYRNGDTEAHRLYLKEESRLDRLEVKTMKLAGVYIPDPCVPGTSKWCCDCTGYYKKNPRHFVGSQNQKQYIICEGVELGSILCNIK